MFGGNKGWQTKTAGILLGVKGLLGMVIFLIAGADATGAVPLNEGILTALGGFGLVGARDAVTKIIDKLDHQTEKASE